MDGYDLEDMAATGVGVVIGMGIVTDMLVEPIVDIELDITLAAEQDIKPEPEDQLPGEAMPIATGQTE